MYVDDIAAEAREVWQNALGTEVDDHTDFFDAGGHSFMAMAIIGMLEEAYQTQIPLRTLFDNPRFDEFVAAVAGKLEDAAASSSAAQQA